MAGRGSRPDQRVTGATLQGRGDSDSARVRQRLLLPDDTVPRQAPVSLPRASMNSLNRCMSPFARRETNPSASPTF